MYSEQRITFILNIIKRAQAQHMSCSTRVWSRRISAWACHLVCGPASRRPHDPTAPMLGSSRISCLGAGHLAPPYYSQITGPEGHLRLLLGQEWPVLAACCWLNRMFAASIDAPTCCITCGQLAASVVHLKLLGIHTSKLIEHVTFSTHIHHAMRVAHIPTAQKTHIQT